MSYVCGCYNYNGPHNNNHNNSDNNSDNRETTMIHRCARYLFLILISSVISSNSVAKPLFESKEPLNAVLSSPLTQI